MAFSTGLEGKPRYVGIIAGLVIAAIAIGLVHYLLVIGINEEIDRSRSELDVLAKKIEKGRSAEKKLPEFREQVARLELELDKLRRILPSSRNTEEIIKKIKSLVDQGDFTLRKLVFPKLNTSASAEIYAEWPISVSIEGGYHNLAVLFNRLGNFSRIVNVESFTITARPDQTVQTITTEFIAKTFVYVEPQEAAPAAAAPAAKGTPGGSEE